MVKKTAPAQAATQDDEALPQTAVKPSAKELMQARLAEYAEKETNDSPVNQPDNEPVTTPTSEEETWKKRYGDLRRHSQAEENTLKKTLSSLQAQIEQLTKAANQPMPKTREEFDAWKQKFPDVVPFIEMIADEKATMSKKQIEEELTSVKDQLKQTEKEKAYAILTRLVPDWEAYVGSSEFQEWKIKQPKSIQTILDTSEEPADLARLINICMQEHQPAGTPPKKDKLSVLDATVKNTGAGPSTSRWKFTQSQIQKMTTEQFAANEADIIAARNNGQVLDDLSRHNTVFDM